MPSDLANAYEFPTMLCPEKAVLGCLMLDADCLNVFKDYAARVKDAKLDLFRKDTNRVLLDGVLALYERGIHPDQTCLMSWLYDANKLQEAGGPSNVLSLATSVFSTLNCKDYLAMLYDRWRRSEVDRVKVDLDNELTGGVDVNVAVAKYGERMKKLIHTDANLITPTVDVMCESAGNLLRIDSAGTLPSSFTKYQSMTGGHVRGHIMLVGAPPGSGKTAFAMQEIDCVLMNSDAVVDAFLAESDMDQYLARYCSRTYGINANKWISKSFSDDERRQVRAAAERMTSYENRLFLSEPGVYNAAKIEVTIRDRKERTGKPCDFIVVDYLQRLGAARPGYSSTDHKSFHENVEILFELATRENAALLLLSQVTMEAIRDSFNKKDKRPGLGAFKGSGSPVEAAKVCMILYKDDQEHLHNAVVEQQFVVCKANNGSTGIVRSLFIKPLTLHIEDNSPTDRAPYAKWMQRFGYDPQTPRKDAGKSEF